MSQREKFGMNLYDFQLLMEMYQTWAAGVFIESTAEASLLHLEKEIKEVRSEIRLFPEMAGPGDPISHNSKKRLAIEYVDCLMCLLHSARKMGINTEELKQAFYEKLMINIGRQWKLNPDLTYSHVKPEQKDPDQEASGASKKDFVFVKDYYDEAFGKTPIIKAGSYLIKEGSLCQSFSEDGKLLGPCFYYPEAKVFREGYAVKPEELPY